MYYTIVKYATRFLNTTKINLTKNQKLISNLFILQYVLVYYIFVVKFDNSAKSYQKYFLPVAINVLLVVYSFSIFSQIWWIPCAKQVRWVQFGNNMVKKLTEFMMYCAATGNGVETKNT